MTRRFSALNAFAAAGICASLAMLGWQVDNHEQLETRYSFSVVLPDNPQNQEQDDPADAPPSLYGDHPDRDNHIWHPGRSHDDGDGPPIAEPDPDAVIPI